MEDANEGADKVVGVGVGPEIAAGDSAIDAGYEGGVDERARAFDEAHGAAGDGVHRRNDEPLAGHVVDKEQHPGAEGFERRHGRGEALLGGGEFFNFAAVDRFDEGVAAGEVAVQRARADGRLAGDIVEAGGGAIAGEDFLCDFKNALPVALRIGARLSARWEWRKLLFRHRQIREKFSATGDSLRLSHYSEPVSVLSSGDADVNSGAILTGSAITAGG